MRSNGLRTSVGQLHTSCMEAEILKLDTPRVFPNTAKNPKPIAKTAATKKKKSTKNARVDDNIDLMLRGNTRTPSQEASRIQTRRSPEIFLAK